MAIVVGIILVGKVLLVLSCFLRVVVVGEIRPRLLRTGEICRRVAAPWADAALAAVATGTIVVMMIGPLDCEQGHKGVVAMCWRVMKRRAQICPGTTTTTSNSGLFAFSHWTPVCPLVGVH